MESGWRVWRNALKGGRNIRPQLQHADFGGVGGKCCPSVHDRDAEAMMRHGQRRVIDLHLDDAGQADLVVVAGLRDDQSDRIGAVDLDHRKFSQVAKRHPSGLLHGARRQAVRHDADQPAVGEMGPRQDRVLLGGKGEPDVGGAQQQRGDDLGRMQRLDPDALMAGCLARDAFSARGRISGGRAITVATRSSSTLPWLRLVATRRPFSRLNSAKPSCESACCRVRLTAGWVTLISRTAALMLPVSMMALKTSRCRSRMIHPRFRPRGP